LRSDPLLKSRPGISALPALAITALGIVFGDIATSPLYALQEAFGAHGVVPTPDNILGVLSLTVWSLILLVSIKYIVFIMRADNHGEGGSMALLALALALALARQAVRFPRAQLAACHVFRDPHQSTCRDRHTHRNLAH